MREVRTVAELYGQIISKYSNPKALNIPKEGNWNHVSTEDFIRDVRYVAMGFRSLGIKRGDCIGLMGPSSPHWTIIDFGIILAGATSVPFFANIAEKNFRFQINDAKVKTFVLSGEEAWDKGSEYFSELENVIRVDVGSDSAGPDGPQITKLDRLIERGKELDETNPQLFDTMLLDAQPGDLITIIYTSGSTGVPKGVELTHTNLVEQVLAAGQLIPASYQIKKALSVLPTAHIFERTITLFYIASDISLYFVDDIQKTADYAREVQPHMMTVVPRILEKVYAKMFSKVEQAKGLARLLGKAAFSVATSESTGFRSIFEPLLDRLIYQKFREGLGGSVKVIISGGAALNPVLARFFTAVGIPVFQGYGMTECPIISTNRPGYDRCGTVGQVFPSLEVKITDEGEITVKGPGVMRGYHNRPDETAVTLRDGWLHTGDRGFFDKEGFLCISGRIKEFLKTSNGKYVSPIPIEQELCQSSLVEGAMVVADGKNFASALLFLCPVALKEKFKDLAYQSMDSLLAQESIRSEFEGLVQQVNQNLNKWEQLKTFRLIPKPLSIEDGELTPTMKMKRFAVLDKYRDIIDSMYGEAGEQI
ncbi:long-chain fatty acid--CoA ligase [bacterium]|jgi:long-chain acyl-CoA synthetase|nr:long-chain fatty acid--CoA ligase [bacterium]